MIRLQSGFDFEAPRLEQWLGNVLGVLVTACPLAQASGSQVLVRRQFVLAYNLFELGDCWCNRPNRLRLTPIWISASLCHGEENLSFLKMTTMTTGLLATSNF